MIFVCRLINWLGWKDVANNALQALDVALLSFGRWAVGDVENDENWILLGSKVFK